MMDTIDRIRAEAHQVIGTVVARKRRHVTQALVFGVLIGYAAGVWTALGAQ